MKEGYVVLSELCVNVSGIVSVSHSSVCFWGNGAERQGGKQIKHDAMEWKGMDSVMTCRYGSCLID